MYPEHGDPEFVSKLMRLKEYQIFKIPETGILSNEEEFDDHTKQVCKNFDKLHQHFVEHYLSQRSPYRSLLLYHSLGVGKTCSAITIAEAMLTGHMSDEPPIVVISSRALQVSFEEQVLGECTDGFYQKLGKHDPKKIANIVKSRYKFITYDGIIAYAKEHNGVIHGKTIIIDEAHNLRNDDDTVSKEYCDVLEKLIKNSAKEASKQGLPSNRLVLLSATPMYDKPQEILWLLDIMLKNDGRSISGFQNMDLFNSDNTLTDRAKTVLGSLAGEYISFIKSRNPFAFAKRLSPSASGIPVQIISEGIEDGIVAVPPGDLQAIDKQNYQAANITYPSAARRPKARARAQEGFPKGFDTMFTKRKTSGHFAVAYSPDHIDGLLPVPNNLGRIAAKMLNICNLIRESEGIVVVYSRFIYDGILPLAIALEHMGMKRHGQENILSRPTLISNPMPRNTSYAILSADSDLMQGTSFKALISDINSDRNKDGKVVKVVLLTQVAGEGLSLYNIREAHIMEPWFHMNRLDQVIGRAIRTCSHVQLPLSKRNVTVFLHAIDDEQGADMHVYTTFVAKKIAQIQQVENLIKTNALDCTLMRNMNYYPQTSFPFTTVMRTSRGVDITVRFGDEQAPYQCSADASAQASQASASSSSSPLYKDTYFHMTQLIVKRIAKALQGHRFMTLDVLEKAVGMDKALFASALPHALHPNTPMKDFSIHLHLNGVVVIPNAVTTSKVKKVKLPSAQQTEEKVQEDEIIQDLPQDNPAILAHELYRRVDESTWDKVAQKIITNPSYNTIALAIREYGSFVYADELGRGSPKTPVGYVDIFNTTSFKVTILDRVSGTFRNAKEDNETKLIQNNRRQVWTQETLTNSKEVLGMFVPEKRGANFARNNFKILVPPKEAVKKSGKVCTSYEVSELRNILSGIKEIPEKMSKADLCIELGFELIKQKRIIMYPQWRPN
jgi:hypothetical protein